MKEVLLNIGLSEKEASSYLIIVKHGEISASELAKINNESRTHSYDTINALIRKSLVTYIVKNNKKLFRAVKPERLLDFVKEKELKIKEEQKQALNLIPQLKNLLGRAKKQSFDIEIYEGVEGLKSILNDILRIKKDFITFGASNKANSLLPDFFIKRYLNERKKKKIYAKQLFTDTSGVWKSPFSENRKLPNEFASPTTIVVYGNKVAMVLYLDTPQVILIDNQILADAYRAYFEPLWKIAKP